MALAAFIEEFRFFSFKYYGKILKKFEEKKNIIPLLKDHFGCCVERIVCGEAGDRKLVKKAV